MKFIIDENLSPYVATCLNDKFGFDATTVRDKDLLSATDPMVLKCAIEENRILITANVKDFEKLATACKTHAGIVLIQKGDLSRNKQIELMDTIVNALNSEVEIGNNMINRVLYISISGTTKFEYLPKL
jgi:predicted nuclease of predicted toxin-antitoxin system